MLLCKHLQRRHHDCLLTKLLDHIIRSNRSYHGLTTSHISLHHTHHWLARIEIIDDLLDTFLLRIGQGKWQSLTHLLDQLSLGRSLNH